jgi:hypothetical protein
MLAMKNSGAQHIDFGFMLGWVESNKKAIPSNIDGVLERNGYFLFMEWKREGEHTSLGQSILLHQLAKLPRVFVICVHGHSDNTGRMISKVSAIRPNGTEEHVGDGEETLKEVVRKFYKYAEDKNAVHRNS